MGWILEIAKALVVCVITTLVLAVITMWPTGNQKAMTVDAIFLLTGTRLALVGVLNFIVGAVLILSRR
jgi:hypothetical protein